MSITRPELNACCLHSTFCLLNLTRRFESHSLFFPSPYSARLSSLQDCIFIRHFLYIILFICLCICLCWILSDVATTSFQPCLCLVSFHSSFGLTLLNIFATRRYFWSEYTAMTLCFQWQCSVLAAISRHKMPCKTASWFKKKIWLYNVIPFLLVEIPGK